MLTRLVWSVVDSLLTVTVPTSQSLVLAPNVVRQTAMIVMVKRLVAGTLMAQVKVGKMVVGMARMQLVVLITVSMGFQLEVSAISQSVIVFRSTVTL